MSRDAYLNLRAFVDELARCGVGHACTSPGSRSTPLVLSLVRDGRLRCWSHLDERSAGFFAVGVAKATGMPCVLACTSGTAAANYAPAVHEAHEARVPLIVLTADRPPELRDIGAGQVIDQVGLYGSAATWFAEIDDAPWSPGRERWLRQTACRAVWTALGPRPGVVHLNWPLREPLVLDAPLPPPAGGRPDGAPWVAPVRPDPAPAARLDLDGRRGVVVAGRDERAGAGAVVAAWAAAAGWPLLADPLSGARRGDAAIAHYDALLRDAGWAGSMRPEVVLRWGDLPTSKPLRTWLATLDDVPQLAVDPQGAWQDPFGGAATVLPGLPALPRSPAPAGWLRSWRAADGAAAAAIADTLGEQLCEPAAAAALAAVAGTVVVASSMPVRDVETFWPAGESLPRVLSNRGANGIDGTISTAYGVAATGERVTLLAGDLAFLHDLGGLLAGPRLELDLTIVLLDNGGGGIFYFLPVSGEGDPFTEHVATPHGLDLARAAPLFGLAWEDVSTLARLRDALAEPPGGGTRVLRVRTDREANVALHRAVWAAVARALGAP